MKKQKKRIILWTSLAVIFLILLIWTLWSNLTFDTTEFTIESNKIPESFDGFRIVQISDLHNTELDENNKTLLTKIQSARPDIIVITGDFIDSRNTDCEIAIAFANEAVKIAPTYYVPGNHESRVSEYSYLQESLCKAGVCILSDENCKITRNGESLHFIGLTDPDFRTDEEMTQLPNILEELSDSESYNILLSHRPEGFTLYKNCDIDLVFTGHAHGGQFRIPGIGGLYAPGQGFFPEYDGGLYTEGNTNMVVNRGIGNSLFPFRFNNPPEIVVLELKSG